MGHLSGIVHHFNPKLVRFKHRRFDFAYPRYRNFNPKLVRFKPVLHDDINERVTDFNPKLVRFKPPRVIMDPLQISEISILN